MNRITRARNLWNARSLHLCLALTAGLSIVALPGCGGGGSSKAVNKTPTKAVKDHIKSLFTGSFSTLAQSGVTNSALSAMRGGIAPAVGVGAGVGSGADTATAAPSDNSSHTVGPPVPQIGQFLHNIGTARKSVRARTIHAMQARHAGIVRLTRDDSSGSGPSNPGTGDPGTGDPQPTFYYDDYLGLWVDINDTPTLSTYSLYEDQAKTKPAGSIVTQIPADDTFPQVYASTYTYTAGSQAGAHGSYRSVYNQDNSGSSTYQDVYTDGTQDQGSSSNTAQGDYTWTGRTDYADKTYTSFKGSFRADGSGGTHSEGSDGYISDYTYNANGAGHARITGPDPGLPVVIDWDTQGNTTIHYADGSTEYIQGWGFGGVPPVATGSGVADSGTTTNTTTTTTGPSKSAQKASR